MATAVADPKAAPTKAVAKVDWNKPTDKNGLEKLGGMIADQLMKSLPGFLQKQGKQNADRMIRALILQAQKTPKLMECSPMSLFGACIEAARLGLEIGGSLGHAYLIPFKGSAQLIIGYKGFNDLAWRSNKVVGVQVGKHCLKDSFEYELGTESFLRHKPADGDRGQVLKYYVTITTTTGKNFDLMTVKELLDFRARYALSKGSGPWFEAAFDDAGVFIPQNGFDWMAWKTIFRRMCKFLPLSPELQTAISLDEASERGELSTYQESVELLTGQTQEQLGNGNGNGGSTTSDDLRRRMENSRAEAAEVVVEATGEVIETLKDYSRAAAKRIADADGSVAFSKAVEAVDAELLKFDPKHVAGTLVVVARRGAGVAENAPLARLGDKPLESAKKAVDLYLEEIGRE